MKAEMCSLRDNDVWELPKDRKPVGSKWVFKVKTNKDGDVERYKARLVAEGFMPGCYVSTEGLSTSSVGYNHSISKWKP